MSKLRKVVQYWESDDGNTGYTVTTVYDDAGVGKVTDSRGQAPPIPLTAVDDAAHNDAIAAVRASVAAGELTPAAGDAAIARLNVERLNTLASSGSLSDQPVIAAPKVEAANRENFERGLPPPVVASAAAKANERVFGAHPEAPSSEPPKSVAKSGPLPPDFPYLDKLHAADPPINTYFQLAKYADDYTKIPGVGPVGAEAITEAVKP